MIIYTVSHCFVKLNSSLKSSGLAIIGRAKMPKVIEFVQDWFAEVETTPGQLQQVAFHRGTKMLADVCPVNGGTQNLVETANLRMMDGRIALHVPISRFSQTG
jgi:hypothetical protein